MDINDYAKHYIGQFCLDSEGQLWKLQGYVKDSFVRLRVPEVVNRPNYGRLTDQKIILLSVKNLQEAQAQELANLLLTGAGEKLMPSKSKPRLYRTEDGFWRAQYGNLYGQWWRIDGSILIQHQTLFLVENGYDAFGLIEKGMALNGLEMALELMLCGTRLPDDYLNHFKR